jgi:hypothetical protein
MYGGWRRWDQAPDCVLDMESELNAANTTLERMLQCVPTYELVREHDDRTMICSVQHHMRRCSGPVYRELMRRYREADILDRRRFVVDVVNYLADGDGGMSVMMLLWDATGQDPTKDHQERIGNTGFVGFDVESCRRAWIEWARERREPGGVWP